MDLDMVFNELSIDTPAGNIQEARQWMAGFINTIRSASAAGVNRVLRTHIDVNNTLLALEYPLARWRNDGDVDLEVRRYFRTLISKHPPLDDLPEIKNDMLAQDFYYQDRQLYGFGIAYLLESLSISLPSSEDWGVNTINIQTQWLDDNGDLVSEGVQIPHASNPFHIDELSGWIEIRLRAGVQNGEDLWSRREELFSNLIFCNHVAKQIYLLQPGDPLFRQIIKRLFELQAYCSAWNEGAFVPDQLPFKATVESPPTIQKYWKERTFNCHGENEITFTWHGRMTPGAWRIYFDPTIGPGMMRIGYIGPKLPTVTDPT
ncbi:hypothetical protein ACFL7E_03435 [Thermodesulfobacteriota bacterium]